MTALQETMTDDEALSFRYNRRGLHNIKCKVDRLDT